MSAPVLPADGNDTEALLALNHWLAGRDAGHAGSLIARDIAMATLLHRALLLLSLSALLSGCAVVSVAYFTTL